MDKNYEIYYIMIKSDDYESFEDAVKNKSVTLYKFYTNRDMFESIYSYYKSIDVMLIVKLENIKVVSRHSMFRVAVYTDLPIQYINDNFRGIYQFGYAIHIKDKNYLEYTNIAYSNYGMPKWLEDNIGVESVEFKVDILPNNMCKIYTDDERFTYLNRIVYKRCAIDDMNFIRIHLNGLVIFDVCAKFVIV